MTEEERKEYYKKYYEANKEKMKATYKRYRAQNKTKIKVMEREYYEANKEKMKATSKRYRAQNKTKIKAMEREYYEANKERKKESIKKYYEKNKEAYYAKAAKRRAQHKKATPAWYKQERDKVILIYAKARKFGFHVDHIVPLRSKKVCGLHTWANLQLLAPEINISKKNRYWPDMP